MHELAFRGATDRPQRAYLPGRGDETLPHHDAFRLRRGRTRSIPIPVPDLVPDPLPARRNIRVLSRPWAPLVTGGGGRAGSDREWDGLTRFWRTRQGPGLVAVDSTFSDSYVARDGIDADAKGSRRGPKVTRTERGFGKASGAWERRTQNRLHRESPQVCTGFSSRPENAAAPSGDSADEAPGPRAPGVSGSRRAARRVRDTGSETGDEALDHSGSVRNDVLRRLHDLHSTECGDSPGLETGSTVGAG